jgi:glycosyltransferase involved in cell wall biosynthesis
VAEAHCLAVSIVTPTLNAERYLAECLATVHAQDYPNLEHIVIDGGSTDRTEQIAREAGVRWMSVPGLNQAGAINVGLRTASGEIVAWLNADDLYLPGSLVRVAEHFSSDPTLDVLCGDCNVVNDQGKLLWRVRPGAYNFDRLLGHGNSVAQPSVFLRKSVFERVGYLDESLDYAMDYELWLRLQPLRVVYVPRVFAAFRWHAQSKTARNQRANWTELLQIVRRYGGGWTPYLIWAYLRARFTLARQMLSRAFAAVPR